MSTQSLASNGHSKLATTGGLGIAVLKLPVSYATADDAVLFTCPDNHYLRVARAYWINTTAWTGGSSSKIGASTSNASGSTDGDIQGGASGDATAAMGTGIKPGTVGAALATGVFLTPGDTIKFNRMTSVYVAGAGYLCVEVIEITDDIAT